MRSVGGGGGRRRCGGGGAARRRRCGRLGRRGAARRGDAARGAGEWLRERPDGRTTPPEMRASRGGSACSTKWGRNSHASKRVCKGFASCDRPGEVFRRPPPEHMASGKMRGVVSASRVGPPAVLSLHALGAQTAQPVLPRGREFGFIPGVVVSRGFVPVCEGFPKTRAPSAVRLGWRVGLRLCGLGEWLPDG